MEKLLKILYYYTAKHCYSNGLYNRITDSNGIVEAIRLMPFRMDEGWSEESGVLCNALPWWLPFNVFMHKWVGSDKGHPHDHPRWSITIVLTGCAREERVDQDIWLRPGSIVFRTHKFIHRIKVPNQYIGKFRTIFIVGRRKWRQHECPSSLSKYDSLKFVE